MIARARHGLPPLPRFRHVNSTIGGCGSDWPSWPTPRPSRTIYNVEVLETTNTFDMVPRTRAEQEAWILEHSGVHPAVVATEPPGSGVDGAVGANGEIVLGFGSPLALPGALGLLGHGREFGLRRPGPARQGGGEGAAGRAPRPGLGPRLPLGHRPYRGAQRDLHRRCTRRPASSSSAWSGRSGASTASGSTSSSCSACCSSRAGESPQASGLRTRAPRSGRGGPGARADASGRSATTSSSCRAGRWPPPTAP